MNNHVGLHFAWISQSDEQYAFCDSCHKHEEVLNGMFEPLSPKKLDCVILELYGNVFQDISKLPLNHVWVSFRNSVSTYIRRINGQEAH